MDDLRHNELPAELADVARRLEEERPALSALELDRIKLQVQRREARPTTPFLTKQRGKLMKSRLAITSMLVVGLLASSTGTGLAISGIGDQGSAGTAQYKVDTPAGTPDVLGKQENTGGDTGVAGAQEGSGDNGVAGAQEGSGEKGVQSSRQVSVSDKGDRLPFTGLAAIPLILMGIALLASGAVLRRRLPEGA